MSDFAILKRQHADILAITHELDQLLESATPNQLPAIVAVRMRLASAIREHLITESEVLYEPLRQRGLINRLPDFAFLAEEIQAARVAYSQHIGTWTRRTIAEDWNGYVRSCRKLFVTIKKLVRLEEASLFPAAQSLLSAVRTPQLTSVA